MRRNENKLFQDLFPSDGICTFNCSLLWIYVGVHKLSIFLIWYSVHGKKCSFFSIEVHQMLGKIQCHQAAPTMQQPENGAQFYPRYFDATGGDFAGGCETLTSLIPLTAPRDERLEYFAACWEQISFWYFQKEVWWGGLSVRYVTRLHHSHHTQKTSLGISNTSALSQLTSLCCWLTFPLLQLWEMSLRALHEPLLMLLLYSHSLFFYSEARFLTNLISVTSHLSAESLLLQCCTEILIGNLNMN